MKIPIILLLLIPLSSAITLEFSCPNEVNLEEEFVCSIEIFDADGVWDVKVDLSEEGSSVARVWDEAEQKWKSAYYYLKEFISVGEQKEIKLKIEAVGTYDGLLKLRKGSTKEEFGFQISVLGGGSNTEPPQEEENNEEEVPEQIQEEEDSPPEETAFLPKNEKTIETPKTISLNSKEVLTLNSNVQPESQIVYESKNFRTLKYAPYFFSLFLVILMAFLILEKF